MHESLSPVARDVLTTHERAGEQRAATRIGSRTIWRRLNRMMR